LPLALDCRRRYRSVVDKTPKKPPKKKKPKK
jgi:hypothetical protein